MVNFALIGGFFLGLRNSMYRLEGLVPNGLAAQSTDTPVKYDYTSEVLKGSLWNICFEPRNK